MESIFFTILGELRTLCTLRRARCRFEVVQKDLMDMLVRELKEELEARDQPKTGNKAWLRRSAEAARREAEPRSCVREHLADSRAI